MMQRRSVPKSFAVAFGHAANVARHPSSMRRQFLCFSLLLFLSLMIAAAQAANTPCSGRKGGISHCAGDTFICNDGSVSASRKSCAAYMGQSGGKMQGLMNNQDVGATSTCSCRSHTYCTGPRGGRYCMTDGGNKSYLRR